MKLERKPLLPFNTPLETGVRSVGIMVAAFPVGFDLQRLVAFDYLVVHTGDMGGPDSLHPDLPMRSAELLVRRALVERGLLLMMSRGLITRQASATGITYYAGEIAETFLMSLESPYLAALRDRAEWAVAEFGSMEDDVLRATLNSAVDQWVEEFHVVHRSITGEA